MNWKRWCSGLATGVASVMLVIACDGGNLFQSTPSVPNQNNSQSGLTVQLRNFTNNMQVKPGGLLLLNAFASDSSGIDSVKINISGVQADSFAFRPGCPAASCPPKGLPSADSVLIAQNYSVGSVAGTLAVAVTAWSRAGKSARATAAVAVTTSAAADTAKPQVRLGMTSGTRSELTDTVTVSVAAQDFGSSALHRVGIVAYVLPAGGSSPIGVVYRDSLYATSRIGLQPAVFKFTLRDFGLSETTLNLPAALSLQVHAFAIDTDGNCGANVTNTLATLPCSLLVVATPPTASQETKWYTAQNRDGLAQADTLVRGFSTSLAAGSKIADVVVDVPHQRMYMSNQSLSRLEVLDLGTKTFTAPVSVGSEPWGMFIDNTGTRLLVANSGGTNISRVDISQPSNIREVQSERILTANLILYNVSFTEITNVTRYTVSGLDFSDRPQFVAQDVNDIVLFSTKPTTAAPDGTVRYLEPTSGRPEPKLLYNRSAIAPVEQSVAIANVDSVIVLRGGDANTSDRIDIWDHVPGDPSNTIHSGYNDLSTSIANLAAQNSDIAAYAGSWARDGIGLSDTTYITTSADRQYVGFGEGGTGPTAQVWLWRAADRAISDAVTVGDLVGNASERVLGIALNKDGSLGAARGLAATYFFSNHTANVGDLRLQGVFSAGVSGGNGGVALHPNHADAVTSSDSSLAFVATASRSIKIVDTFSYHELGEIPIRDNITGPLRSSTPLSTENVGLTPDRCNAIVVKLYGATTAGRAVIIDVRRKDISALSCVP